MTEKAPVKSGAFSFERGSGPAVRMTAWPHRSLPRRGFAWFLLATWAMLVLPLMAVIGTIILWALLPFVLGTLALLWFFLERSYHSGRIVEDLQIWPDRITLVRTEPDGTVRDWEANPHWVRVNLHRKGPVEDYLTLTGNGREVEVGAFLSPEERQELHAALSRVLSELR